MTAVVPDSPALRTWLGALPADDKPEIRAKRHPWLGRPRMLYLVGRSHRGDTLVLQVIELFGQCRWVGGSGGRWQIERAQLSLFPSTPPAPAPLQVPRAS